MIKSIKKQQKKIYLERNEKKNKSIQIKSHTNLLMQEI